MRIHRLPPAARCPLPLRYGIGVAIALLCFALAASAQESDAEPSADKLITPAADRAIERGLKWLAAQQHDDGGFGSGAAPRQRGRLRLGGHGHDVGRQHARPRPLWRPNEPLRRLSSWPTPSRAASSPGPTPATARCTATASPRCSWPNATACRRGPNCAKNSPRPCRLSSTARTKTGGWRYQPVRADADISVTVCQIMALRAARNAGLFVPSETIDRAIDYVKRSQNADGGFMYMLQGGESAFPRSAAAVAALYSAGIYEGPEIDKGLDYLDAIHAAPKASSAARAITSTAITTPCRRCGTPAASAGPLVSGRSRRTDRPAARRRLVDVASTPKETNAPRPWPASCCRCPTTICRSFRDRDKGSGIGGQGSVASG